MRERFITLTTVAAALAACLAAPAVLAQTDLHNDGWEPGQQAFFQGGFVTGETAAVRLVPAGPCPCPVTRVRFLFGDTATQQTITLHIWDDRTGTAVPGAELFFGDYQITGSVNQFVEIDLDADNVAVLGAFRVGIEFSHTGLPSVARDDDGNITAARNFIDEATLGWIDSSLLVPGDWIIRADVGAEGAVPESDDLRNDGWFSGQTAAFQQGFLAGETAAVRLVPHGTCPCPLNRVRFLFGGAQTIETITLRVWDDGAGTPDPGAELYAGVFEIGGFDEALLEIDLTREGIEVTGPFRVGIEFSHAGLPSVARDTDGDITAARNFIEDATLSWIDSSLLVPGDWIIRASVGDTASPTPEIANDDWFTGQTASFQQGFAIGETAAARLVPDGPCPCALETVRFLFGGSQAIETITLHVWDDSAGTPDPGAELYAGEFEIGGFDEALLEIDLRAEDIPLTGPFRVGIEFTHAGLPSVARDVDGAITPDRNFIDELAQGWVEASTLGVTGDWVIRATVASDPTSLELTNDDWSSGEEASFEGGLAANDVAASRLVPVGPCPCPVSRVRFLFGGAVGGQTVTLHIWDDSAGTTEPGSELFSGSFPLTALDDGLQEIDLGDQDLSIDGPVRVGLGFPQAGLPSLARDDDGITVQRNFVELTGVGWVEATSGGLTGDWILRLVLVPEPTAATLQLAALALLAALACVNRAGTSLARSASVHPTA